MAEQSFVIIFFLLLIVAKIILLIHLIRKRRRAEETRIHADEAALVQRLPLVEDPMTQRFLMAPEAELQDSNHPALPPPAYTPKDLHLEFANDPPPPPFSAANTATLPDTTLPLPSSSSATVEPQVPAGESSSHAHRRSLPNIASANRVLIPTTGAALRRISSISNRTISSRRPSYVVTIPAQFLIPTSPHESASRSIQASASVLAFSSNSTSNSNSSNSSRVSTSRLRARSHSLSILPSHAREGGEEDGEEQMDTATVGALSPLPAPPPSSSSPSSSSPISPSSTTQGHGRRWSFSHFWTRTRRPTEVESGLGIGEGEALTRSRSITPIRPEPDMSGVYSHMVIHM